jgi:hypothetical protein
MIWKDYDSSLHQWMLKLTERFDLTFSVPEESDKFNIVPCLLAATAHDLILSAGSDSTQVLMRTCFFCSIYTHYFNFLAHKKNQLYSCKNLHF